MKRQIRRREFLAGAAAAGLAAADAAAQREPDDPYARYVRTSEDFRRVKQDRAWADRAFPGWIYMPWTYQWNIGYTDASGRWSLQHGYNGAFLDGNGGSPDSPAGKLAWIDKFRLHFYVDHTAGKGFLHLWDGGKQKPHLAELHGTGVRAVPVNDALRDKLRERIRTNVSQVKASPMRSAYALDDEISWGHFVHPTMWRVTDDAAAYPRWLRDIYGPNAPERNEWITYDAIRPHLPEWSVREFDASPLMDQWSFNDSIWCNFLGGLVVYANRLDSDTPCGFVGGQSPNAFGGYDYAKLIRKIQYIEAYNLGSSQAIIRSFSPHNAVAAVTSHFHQSVEDDVWQCWYYLAHGNRGHIGWVEGWFDGETPNPWHDAVAAHYKEAGDKVGPLMRGAEWMHDGVAIYYSHPSIQLGWIMDAEAHGKTWVNRDGDHRLGGSHLVRHAWENMLRDSGLQYSFLSHIDAIQGGVPAEYHTLILPACLCLSDAEARAIEAFCRRGGTVIADYMPGLWDQHGRGRATGGALDALFGVRHDPAMTAKGVFGGRLWCEADQDANFGYKTYRDLLTNANSCMKDATGFHKAVRELPVGSVRQVGAGRAVLLNLSPQWYNAYRVEGRTAAARRDTFMRHVVGTGGARRWVELAPINGANVPHRTAAKSPSPSERSERPGEGDLGGEVSSADALFGYEITYFRSPGGRIILFICWNPEVGGNEAGGGNAVGLKSGPVDCALKFARPVRNVRDERRGASLGSGNMFKFTWRRNEAIVISMDGGPA